MTIEAKTLQKAHGKNSRFGASAPYVATIFGLLALSAVSVFLGAADLAAPADGTTGRAANLLSESRLPRTFAALLAGASMAVSGVIMQLLVRNKFVEPSVTGVTEAAMLGLLAVTLWRPELSIAGKMAAACVAALLGAGVFLLLIRRLPPAQPLLKPLVGLVYGGVVSGAAIFIAYQTDMLQYLGVWMSGDLSGVLAGRYEFLWLASLITAVAYVAADQFTLAGLGRTRSIGLGLNYGQVVAVGLATLSVASALVVVTIGLIPFIGLVAPNIVSRIMGDNLRRSLPVVAGVGAGLVLGSDVVGRLVRYPYEIPTGVICGVLGAGIFLWLLLAPRREAA